MQLIAVSEALEFDE